MGVSDKKGKQGYFRDTYLYFLIKNYDLMAIREVQKRSHNICFIEN